MKGGQFFGCPVCKEGLAKKLAIEIEWFGFVWIIIT